MLMGFQKKKKIKTMNNKMAKIHIYQQLNLKKEANKKNTDTIMDTESILMDARCEGDVGEWVKR